MKAILKMIPILDSKKPEFETLVDALYDQLRLSEEVREIRKTPFEYTRGDIEVLANSAVSINKLEELDSKLPIYEKYFSDRYHDWICLVLEVGGKAYAYTRRDVVMNLRGMVVHKDDHKNDKERRRYLRRFLTGEHFRVLFYDLGRLSACARDGSEGDWFADEDNRFPMQFTTLHKAALREAVFLGIIMDFSYLAANPAQLPGTPTPPPTNYLKNKDAGIYETIKKQHVVSRGPDD